MIFTSSSPSLSPTAPRTGQGLELRLSQIYKLPSLGKGKAKGRLPPQWRHMNSHLTLEGPQQALRRGVRHFLLFHAHSHCHDRHGPDIY